MTQTRPVSNWSHVRDMNATAVGIPKSPTKLEKINWHCCSADARTSYWTLGLYLHECAQPVKKTLQSKWKVTMRQVLQNTRKGTCYYFLWYRYPAKRKEYGTKVFLSIGVSKVCESLQRHDSLPFHVSRPWCINEANWACHNPAGQ